MRRERIAALLGPGGTRSVALLAFWAAVRAGGLVLIADGLAGAIASLAAGRTDVMVPCIVAAAGALVRAAATWAEGVTAARGAITAKERLRAELAAHAVARGGRPSDAVLASDGVAALDEYYASAIPAAVAAVVVTAAVGGRILVADLPSAVVVAVTLPLIPLFMVLIGMHTRERVDAAQSALTRLADHLAELAHGLPVLVGLGRAAEQTAALAAIQEDYRRRTRATLRVTFLSALALELIATLSVAVVAVMLGVRLLDGSVGLSAALIALLLAPECFAALRTVGAAFHSSQDGRSALRRIRSLLADRVAALPRRGAGPATLAAVSVRFPGRAAPALTEVHARFAHGSVTRVSGPSGSGKSTLLGVLTGTLDPAAVVTGRVTGVDPRRVAYVPQVIRTAADTVRGELELYGAADPDAMLARFDLVAVADAAPATLSPGERRRLGVARAMARVANGATLLVLDEPTAHLDAASARVVRRAIRDTGPAVATVLVTHDPATAALADAELSLGGGGIIATTDDDADARAATRAARPVVASPAARPLRVLRDLLGPAAPSWVAASAAGVTSVAFGLALIAVSGWLIVRAGSQPAIMYLLVAIVGVRFFGLARSAMRYVERLLTHDAAFRLSDELRLRLWSAIAARGAGSRDLLEGGTALDYLIGLTARIRDLLPRVITPLAVSAVTAVGVVVTTAIVLPALTLPVALGLVASIAVAVAVARADRRGQTAMVALASRHARGFARLADAAADLRANGVGERAAADVDGLAVALARHERASSWRAGAGVAAVTAGTALLASLSPLLAAGAAAEPVAVVALLLLAAGEPLASAVVAAQRIPALAAALTRVGMLLGAPTPALPAVGRTVAHPRAIELRDAAVTWPGGTEPVFDPVSAEVTRTAWLVVRGPSGSGKSTLLSALMGAVPLSGGSIRVDDAPLTAVAASEWSRAVAWCPQEAHVFDSSLRANLLLARPRTHPVTDDEMRDVLRRVGLAPLLADLDDGLGAPVGSSGRSLSGGERQRVAVARALLGEADVLLLDEPTAHLDAATAQAMMEDIRAASAGRLVVLVSHRAADIADTDHVIDLGHGTKVPVEGAGVFVA